MRSLILFISLVLAGLVLIAGCTGTTSDVQETPAPTDVSTQAAVTPVQTETPVKATVSIDSAVTLGKMHGVMMEAIEESLAYPVLNEPEEKSDFEAKVKEFDLLAVMFEKEAELDKAENAEIKKSFDAITLMKGKLVEDANSFFAGYEKEGVVSGEEVAVLEESIDSFTSAFGPFTKSYFAMVSEEDLNDNEHARAAFDLLLMHHDLMEGIEEAFGYVLLNESVEKEEFAASMQSFDEAGNAFVNDGYLDNSENKVRLAAYTEMMDAKEKMVNSAYVMFADFEDTASVSKNTAEAFEKEVDATTTAYEKLLKEVLKDL